MSSVRLVLQDRSGGIAAKVIEAEYQSGRELGSAQRPASAARDVAPSTYLQTDIEVRDVLVETAGTPTATVRACAQHSSPSRGSGRSRARPAGLPAQRIWPAPDASGGPWLFRRLAVGPRRRCCRCSYRPARKHRSPGPGGWARCCRRPTRAENSQSSETVRFLRSGRSVWPPPW